MQCRLWSFLLCGASLIGLAGCMSVGLNMSNGFTQLAHSSESSIISSFIADLEKSDMENLKEITSTDFKGSALRHSKSMDSFKMLNIPDGKVQIVEVKEKSAEEKRVLVKIGPKERKLYFDLIYDTKAKKWVIDDVEFKKNLKPGQVNKSITEQMDLLLAIQEFLDAWEAGERTQILATSTTELSRSLEPLPSKSLKKFTAKVAADLKRDSIKPEVEGHATTALVNLKRKGGGLSLTMRFENDKWLADDIAVESKKEEGAISSVRKQAQVLLTAIRFCNAYQTDNKAELEKTSQTRFFRSVLQPADLSKVPLQFKQAEEEDYDVKVLLTRAEVLIRQKDQIVHLTLSQGPIELDIEGKAIETSADAGKPYLVDELTLHEISTNQEKRLSAMFSSQSLVMVFADALGNADLKSLRFQSTTDFQNRVWSRIELADLADLSMDQIESARPVILDTAFKGPLTEVTVNQGSTPLTYVLRDQNGRLLVDDVLLPALDRPNSLKMNLEVQIPLRNFAKGLHTGDMRLVRDHASREFNKLVFQSMNRMPKIQSDPAPFLQEPLKKVQLTTDRALLVLGDDKYGARVLMTKENDHYMIDDIVMVSGPEQSQRKGLKQSLRQLVLSGTRFGNAAAKHPLVPHSLDETEDDTAPAVLSSDPKPTSNPDDAEASNLDSRSARILPARRSRQPQPELSRRSSLGRRNLAPQDGPETDSRLERSPQVDRDAELETDSMDTPRARRTSDARPIVRSRPTRRTSESDELDSFGTQPSMESSESEPDHSDDSQVIRPNP
ncbi:MAG: hypothetical protein JWM11_8039 [Planctomycetaceae bacterium]|nr:hypothetical protein [Planctomycetaceae bacterium]